MAGNQPKRVYGAPIAFPDEQVPLFGDASCKMCEYSRRVRHHRDPDVRKAAWDDGYRSDLCAFCYNVAERAAIGTYGGG